MADLTPDRLQELLRIAAETAPGTHEWRIIETALALLNRIEALETENYNLDIENHELYHRIERLEARAARQRVAISRLQAAVERRNSQERIEALRRKLSDEKKLLDRIEALEQERDAARAEAERWQTALVAASEVIEAARRVVNNKYDADPADVHDLAEALKRYDERCGGGDQ